VSETQLSRSIQDALAGVGLWCIRVHSGKVRVRGGWLQLAEPGTPDLYCIALCWFEVKLPGQKPNADQLKWHARAKAMGEKVYVVSSVEEAVEHGLAEKQCLEYERANGWR
jgi:hypothetical protein